MTQHRNFILYKPVGYLSQFINNQSKRKNKKLLGALYDFPAGTMAIGRLDENSEGLLLLTTNGKTSALITSGKVEKEYLVEVDGTIDTKAVNQLKLGVGIAVKGKPYTTKPCQAQLVVSGEYADFTSQKNRHEKHGPTSWMTITVAEGKFRQIRKMTAVVGHPTLRLVRIRIGNIQLNNMKAGEVLEVDDFNV